MRPRPVRLSRRKGKPNMTPTPTSTATPTPTATAPAETELQKILGDLFLIGAAAASVFVKNPASQARAGSIIAILQDLLPLL